MNLVIALVIVAAIVGIGVFVAKANQRSRPSEVRTARTLFNLQLGDLVEFEGLEWFVEDVLQYNDSGYKWTEYRVQADTESRWLSVEQDDELYVSWMRNKSGVEITGEPPKRLTVDGVDYRLDERGTAQLSRAGGLQADTCQYYEYEGVEDDRQLMSIEDWGGGKIEVAVGRSISPRMVTLTAGDGKRVYGETI
ncbi:DUF4178 domain-containing protein [filamentous cyanobacterium LEGE 11480]|uniref:DUF4178 domain-containing protein n=1 Tax=Romeriopsis navalis LEGE 11480 TaxID=2777977 RepID=A0A928VVW6_9CYAN|nr:DUF4178 domain-containing protein [Romeriopsis navalis]MBE9033457.1 DUF4178 domain-containing protein [Romeriopsis navalis LEGE 11480]